MSFNEYEKEVNNEKFRWIELSLVGATAGIILITQGVRSYYFLSAMFIFIILCIFNAVGIFIVNEYPLGLEDYSLKTKLFHYNSTLISVFLISIAFILLAIGSTLLLSI